MLSSNLQKLMLEKKLTLEQLSDLSEVPIETIRNIYYKRAENPRVNTIFSIAKALDVPIETLVTDISSQDSKLLTRYHQAGEHGRHLIDMLTAIEASLTIAQRSSCNKFLVPCIEVDAPFQDAVSYHLCSFSTTFTTYSQVSFALKIPDNSFAPRYCKKDLLFFENKYPASGQNALFFYQEFLYLRCYYEDNDSFRLSAISGRGKDIFLNRMDQYKLVGTCIGISRI